MNYIVIVYFSHDEEQNGGKPPPTKEEVIESVYTRPWGPEGTLVDVKEISVDRY